MTRSASPPVTGGPEPKPKPKPRPRGAKAEHARLAEADDGTAPWRDWGPYR